MLFEAGHKLHDHEEHAPRDSCIEVPLHLSDLGFHPCHVVHVLGKEQVASFFDVPPEDIVRTDLEQGKVDERPDALDCCKGEEKCRDGQDACELACDGTPRSYGQKGRPLRCSR